mgnify:CR=1 FL=1
MKQELKTSDDWDQEYPDITVLDPDGWDRSNYQFSWFEEKITKDLHKDWTILSEGVQTLLRSKNITDPYSLVATLTRGKHISQKEWEAWVSDLGISDEEKKHLSNLKKVVHLWRHKF